MCLQLIQLQQMIHNMLSPIMLLTMLKQFTHSHHIAFIAHLDPLIGYVVIIISLVTQMIMSDVTSCVMSSVSNFPPFRDWTRHCFLTCISFTYIILVYARGAQPQQLP